MENKIHLGEKLIAWYKLNARDLPWRKNIKNPYHTWISEIILQQTQVKQGKGYYLRFIERFPNVKSLSEADIDEVLLYWKGLGYYSRAINLHKASLQIMNEFGGVFPKNYKDILKLKGIGKYTAGAISSICFDERIPAVDGNFYRVLSRLFADKMDISLSKAFDYYAQLALQMMPKYGAGDFNQAIMDIGSEICKPKNPLCDDCPLNDDCLALATQSVQNFPIKTKKTKIEALDLKYYFVEYNENFLIKQRGSQSIWKHLYEFPTTIPHSWEGFIINCTTVEHKLTHKKLSITFYHIIIKNKEEFEEFSDKYLYAIVNKNESEQKSFPKPLQNYIDRL